VRAATAALVLAVALVLGGCGGDEEGAAPAPPAPVVPSGPSCEGIGEHEEIVYELCWRPNSREHGTFVVAEGDERAVVPVQPPFRPAGQPLIGHWRQATLSPDGRWLLLEWSAECEVPFTFVVRSSGGPVRPAFGRARRWWDAQPSTAVGWLNDGTAIVETHSQCGGPQARRLVRVQVDG
jgi:hypothetical protein